MAYQDKNKNGVPQTLSAPIQPQQPELAFRPAPEAIPLPQAPSAPQAGLMEILNAVAGLGLNVASAVQGRGGAAGQGNLSLAAQLRQQAEQEARMQADNDFQRAQIEARNKTQEQDINSKKAIAQSSVGLLEKIKNPAARQAAQVALENLDQNQFDQILGLDIANQRFEQAQGRERLGDKRLDIQAKQGAIDAEIERLKGETDKETIARGRIGEWTKTLTEEQIKDEDAFMSQYKLFLGQLRSKDGIDTKPLSDLAFIKGIRADLENAVDENSPNIFQKYWNGKKGFNDDPTVKEAVAGRVTGPGFDPGQYQKSLENLATISKLKQLREQIVDVDPEFQRKVQGVSGGGEQKRAPGSDNKKKQEDDRRAALIAEAKRRGLKVP